MKSHLLFGKDPFAIVVDFLYTYTTISIPSKSLTKSLVKQDLMLASLRSGGANAMALRAALRPKLAGEQVAT